MTVRILRMMNWRIEKTNEEIVVVLYKYNMYATTIPVTGAITIPIPITISMQI